MFDRYSNLVGPKLFTRGRVVVLLVAIIFLYGLAGMTYIDPGQVGVVVKNIGPDRGMQNFTLDTGLHWLEPFINDVIVYDTRLKQYQLVGKGAVPANTADGQPVVVDVSFEIGLTDGGVPYLHENVGVGYWDQVILPLARSTLRNATSQLLSDTIYTGDGRLMIQGTVAAEMKKRLTRLGIRIETNLRDITFQNKDFVNTLEQKAKAAQLEEIQRREALAAAQEAIKVQNIAEGQKFKVMQEAEAERERLRLLGEGQRLHEEQRALGILAVATAEAEGIRLKNEALSGPGGDRQVSIAWAENLGPNVKVYGVPTGAPGTNTFLFDQALRGTVAQAAAIGAGVSQ